MKYNVKEHPQIFLFLIAVFMLIISIIINVIYNWVIYAVFMVVLAGIAVLVLGYSFFYDLYLFSKKKKKYDEEHAGEIKNDD